MSTTNHRHTSSTILPPISMFTSRSPPPTAANHATSSLMPASPPTGYDKHLLNKSLPILPKPHGDLYKQDDLAPPPEILTSPPTSYYHQNNSSPNYTNPPDQSTLWALFNQFQKQQQRQQSGLFRQEDSSGSNNRRASDPTDRAALSSEEVLAEKRRRNAGASARFRDRRKQRERELQDKCHELEQRSKEFETALRRLDPEHPLLATIVTASRSSSPAQQHSSTDYQSISDQHTLFDRVGHLEHMMTRFRQEKETDVQKLEELEKENKYLRSLLVPVNLSATPKATSQSSSSSSNSSSPTSTTNDSSRRRGNKHRRSFDDQDSLPSSYKRIHLSPSSNIESYRNSPDSTSPQ